MRMIMRILLLQNELAVSSSVLKCVISNILVILAVRNNILAGLYCLPISDTIENYSCFITSELMFRTILDKNNNGLLRPLTGLTRHGKRQDGLVTKIC